MATAMKKVSAKPAVKASAKPAVKAVGKKAASAPKSTASMPAGLKAYWDKKGKK